jgi:hypothetical protein
VTRRRCGALVVACAVLALSACASNGSGRAVTTTTTRTVPPPAPRVLVLGDSNLFQSAAIVEAALRDTGYEPTTLGVPGYGLKDMFFWLEQLPALLDTDPDVVVVGLGTNDTGNTNDIERFPARLDRMMQALGDRPVIWITHVSKRPGAPASAGATINEFIRAAPERWPNLTVLDFGVDIEHDPTILSYDNLHFSPNGMQAYAARIAATVTLACRADRRCVNRLP